MRITAAWHKEAFKPASAGMGQNNLRFKNTAELTIQDSTWTRWASQPYYVDDYLSKKRVPRQMPIRAEVVWTLNN
ncbi:MAG: hypothetical protein ACLVD8_27410 [Enterocloster sp.]|uniref:hypothetical protein n=1 Tax=Enterocloster sp. TaxID=2719315 RepID=UPI00399AE845